MGLIQLWPCKALYLSHLWSPRNCNIRVLLHPDCYMLNFFTWVIKEVSYRWINTHKILQNTASTSVHNSHITPKCFWLRNYTNQKAVHWLVVAFSSLARIWGECSTISFQPLRFKKKKKEIRSHTVTPLFRPGSVHRGSASWDDCSWVFPDELSVNLLSDRFPLYAWTAVKSACSNFIWSKV